MDAVDLEGLMAGIEALVERGDATVSYLNIHVANTAWRDLELRAFLEQVDLCYCDGAGVVLGAKIAGEVLPGRITGADWIWPLAALASDRSWRLFWLGGDPGVSESAAEALRALHPELSIQADHGFHDAAATPGLLDRINAFAPHILLVGMGTPTQEHWVVRHRAAIDAPIVWCLGATADFVSGRVDRGPEWLHGRQEWLARLLNDPGRLWRRYLIGNPKFLCRVLRERIGQ